MNPKVDRREVLCGAAATLFALGAPAWAQDKSKLRFSAVFSDLASVDPLDSSDFDSAAAPSELRPSPPLRP